MTIEQYEREDQQRWDEYQATGQAIPHTEVEAWLLSWRTDHELPVPTIRTLSE